MSPPINWTLDTLHQTRESLLRMFPGRTVAAQKKMQANFVNDLATRCHAEHAGAMPGGATWTANKRVMTAKEAIILCYQGNHDGWRRKSQVCKAKKASNWVSQSVYLTDDLKIRPNQKDIEQLNECIDYRLGHDVMKKVKYLQNTQKVESVNRAIGIRNPKNMTFTRNSRVRVSPAVHAVNDGVAESIVSSCRESGSRITRGLVALDRQNHLKKTFKKSKDCYQFKKTKTQKTRQASLKSGLIKQRTDQEC